MSVHGPLQLFQKMRALEILCSSWPNEYFSEVGEPAAIASHDKLPQNFKFATPAPTLSGGHVPTCLRTDLEFL